MELVLAYDRPQEISDLVTEYTNTILQHGSDVRQCLSVQHLEKELEDLAQKYGLPGGRMYLALVDGQAAGCAALTKNDNDHCEIKRLYVRPEFRGLHIGRALAEQIIEDARHIGYQHMRLDTFPFMETAIRLYGDLGFYPIERYNDNPARTAVFMQLDL